MKHLFPICLPLIFAVPHVAAQISSHAPTVFSQTPRSQAQGLVALSPSAKPVVRVNGSVLTEADLVREEYTIFPYARQHNGLPREMAPQIRDGAMKMLVFEELVYQEAERRKISVPPAKMQRAEADFRKQFSTSAEYNAFLQSEVQGSQQLLREKIRRSILIDTLLKSEVEGKSAVTPAEAKAFYDKNPARFEHPEQFTFQTISILPPDKATPDQLKEGQVRADKALTQARATKSTEEFGLLAEKISDDDFRVVMGQHKPVPASDLAPQVEKTLRAMKPGDVSDVIQIDQAYTIVRLNVHTPAGQTKFEEVKDALTKELHETKTNSLRSALNKKLQATAKIEQMQGS